MNIQSNSFGTSQQNSVTPFSETTEVDLEKKKKKKKESLKNMDYATSPDFPSASGWVDIDWIFNFGWIVPLGLRTIEDHFR